MKDWIYIFLTAALVGSEWPTSRLCYFIFVERAWVRRRTDINYAERSKILSVPGPELGSDPAAFQPVARPCTVKC
jgi:hypothetical protein